MSGTPGSQCTIALPANTTYLTVNGTRGYQQGSVTFSLSPPPPAEGRPTTVATDNYYNFTAELYETPVDPTVLCNLTITIGDNGSAMVESVKVYSSLE